MAAQDAELKLKVSLDLGFFRQQLTGLGQAAAGYNLPVKVQFDRRSVQNELNALGANIRRRNYTLNVNTNLKAEIANAKTLAEELENLGRVRAAGKGGLRQQMGIGALLPGPQSGGIGSKEVAKLYKAAAKAGILEFDKEIARTKAAMVAALDLVGRDAIAGLLNGLASQDERLKTAAASIGENLIKTIKGVLGMASPSREFRKIGEDTGKGFELGLLKAMEIAERSATRQMRRMIDRLARMALMVGGMSAAEISRQVGQARALPPLNFPATVPSRSVSIGPSGTGRALPPGPTREALPGTAFGAQRYLPTALSDELKQILRGAAFAFVDSIRTQTRSVRIGIGASMQAALPAARVAGLLPAGVGREPSRYSTGAIGGESREQMMARRTAEAYARSALRGMDVMGGGAGRPPSPYSYAYRSARPTSAIVPYAAGGAMVAGPRQAPEALTGQATPFASPLPKNYLEIGKAIKGLDPILQRSSVPFSGAIRELGQEFGFAIKQVLLFGTAYKALAFFTDLPAQALNASKELQSFNNQLNAITGSSSNAQRSVQFINDTVAQFNVPLQSAREGFLRLYASMSPAGMEADTIEDLFVGISQASATLGLSADQVDRVTYAFSQMASKGKVMSEEVTGQLGDVIPGALSLMADAAGLSMAEFKDAMEAGQVSGKAMEQLFTNLPIVMEERFGKGAAGAAKTLQGQLNDLATTTKRMYEAFEPLVTSIANQILPAVSAAMKDTQSAVEAFGMKIQGINPATNLLSENAQALYKNFEIVADTASSVGSIIQSLGGIFSTLGNIVSGALQLFNALAANPVGEFFVRLAVNIGIATAAINLFVKSGIIAATQQLLLFVGNIKLTIGALRALITTSRAAKIAVGGIVAGTIMVGLEMLVTHLTKVRQETDKLKNSALLAADALSQMTFQQLVAQEVTVKKMIQNLERLQAAAGGGLKITRPTKEQEAMARELGLPVAGRAGQRAISMVRAEGARQQLLEQLPQIRGAMDRKFEAPTTAAITPIDLTAGEEETKKATKARKSLNELVSTQILMLAEAEKAMIKLAKAETVALSTDTPQAKRMLDYYAKFRNNLVDIQAIQAQLAIAEKNRGKFISEYGMSAEQIDGNIKELRNQLVIATTDLATTEQEYRNRAKGDAADEAAEMEKKIERQKELNRLLEDAAIAAGQISPQQAAIIQQRREQSDVFARAQGLGASPEQLQSLQQLQLATPDAGSMQEYIQKLREELQQLISVQNLAAVSARGIGEALGEALTTGVASLISGTATAKEVFASFLQSVGQTLSQAASQMIATYIAIGIAKLFAGLGGGGGDSANMAKSGITENTLAPMRQYSMEGPLTGTLGGVGMANGGIAQGGFRAFANGGVVSGPTLGLIGEGKYNEAVVPLPDGRSIPVQLGGRSARDMMGGNAPGMPQAPSLSMKFETTKINGVEYVSREQLEQAMAETRRSSIAGGAQRGMSMTLDKIKQSPSTRSSIGIR